MANIKHNFNPTAQDIFDGVVLHAAQMPNKSMNGPADALTARCVYRADDGNACFVGGIVTDCECEGWDDTSCTMGFGTTVQFLFKNDRLPSRLTPHVDLLEKLQEVHDRDEMDEWVNGLKSVAVQFGLDSSIVDKAFGQNDQPPVAMDDRILEPA